MLTSYPYLFLVLPNVAPFPVDDMLFSVTWACNLQEKGLVTRGYIIAIHGIVTNSYIRTAGDNQLHDSTITSQQKLARTYYHENIFTRVIKCR